MCYVVQNYDTSLKEADESHSCDKNYELPDGRKILIGKERFQATEILFNPKLAKSDTKPVQQFCYESIMKCDEDVRRDLYQNVILTGGTTLFQGLGERLLIELDDLAPPTHKVKILAAPERQFSVWLGGSILASLSTFATMWINK